MRSQEFTIVFFIFGFIFVSNVLGNENSLVINVQNQKLDIRAKGVTLGRVLQGVAKKSNIKLTMLSEFDIPLDISIQSSSLEALLKNLGRQYSLIVAIVYEEDQLNPKLSPIVEVIVHSGRDATEQLYVADQERESVSRLSGMRDELSIKQLTNSLATAHDIEARMQTVELLRQTGNEQALTSLETGLGDDNSGVRIASLKAIAGIRGDDALLLLGQAVIGDKNPDVRRAALELLQDNKQEAAIAFIKTALNDSDSGVRRIAKQVFMNK